MTQVEWPPRDPDEVAIVIESERWVCFFADAFSDSGFGRRLARSRFGNGRVRISME